MKIILFGCNNYIRVVEQLINMQDPNHIDSIIYEEKQGSYQNISNLLGIDEIEQNSIKSNPKCLMCPNYRVMIQEMEDKHEKLKRKQQKYKNVFRELENHNCLVMQDTDNAVKIFQDIVSKLQSETFERDQIIADLTDEIQHYKNLISDQSYQYEETITQLTQKNSEIVVQNTQKMKKIAKAHKDQILFKNKQINKLKGQILKQVSEKVALQKKQREEARKIEIQIFELKEEIKSLQSQKQSKQRLIKCLSDSNNEIRIQLIEIKSKLQFQEVTWMTDKKRSFLNEYEEEHKLKRENEQLKSMTESLHIELQNLMSETEQMQTLLVKTKLQRDMFKKTSEKLRSYSSDSRIGYGSIQKNMVLQNTHKLMRQKTQQSDRHQAPGRIRVNKTALTSANQSSVYSNQIVEEDYENSIN